MRIFTIVIRLWDTFGTPLPDVEIAAESAKAACSIALSRLRSDQCAESIECVAERDLDAPRRTN